MTMITTAAARALPADLPLIRLHLLRAGSPAPAARGVDFVSES